MEQLVGVKRTASEMAGSDTPGMHSVLETMRVEQVPSTDAMQVCHWDNGSTAVLIHHFSSFSSKKRVILLPGLVAQYS